MKNFAPPLFTSRSKPATAPSLIWFRPPVRKRELRCALSIHPLGVEDMVTDVNRPKVDNYGDMVEVEGESYIEEHEPAVDITEGE